MSCSGNRRRTTSLVDTPHIQVIEARRKTQAFQSHRFTVPRLRISGRVKSSRSVLVVEADPAAVAGDSDAEDRTGNGFRRVVQDLDVQAVAEAISAVGLP